MGSGCALLAGLGAGLGAASATSARTGAVAGCEGFLEALLSTTTGIACDGAVGTGAGAGAGAGCAGSRGTVGLPLALGAIGVCVAGDAGVASDARGASSSSGTGVSNDTIHIARAMTPITPAMIAALSGLRRDAFDVVTIPPTLACVHRASFALAHDDRLR